MTEAIVHADLAPLGLFDTSPGNYSLILGDHHFAEAAGLFEAVGQEVSGYSWDAVARTAVRVHAPELADRIGGFDPEAGMMCVYGEDEAALRELGLILSSAFHDRVKLAALIEATDPGDWD
ncbi:Imm51 family immunity protein [Streptomyces sp. WI04-05B]|uniref:Imm51 family immunity protein n=1 Tax=Streptomyces TaxID=1883 RepID=UPI0029AD92AE|nr:MULTISPECIES: Imm51 family immunity protein [unclassified Streptomyces]MDX2545356.1 Imm51 family immunity protein [Streptomyces sp. WI04-05B]MDX2588149.1 Imm51 family immunity protein [Streptomyces sp. WI04-05A]